MNSFSWSYGDNNRKKENSSRQERIKAKEHTRLVIDEDSIYEIDLDCIECEKREKDRRRKKNLFLN